MTRLNRAMSVGGILLLGLTVTCKESKKSSPAPAQQQSPAPCTPTTQTQNPYGTSQGGTNQGYGTSAYGSTGNNTMLLQNGTATGSVVSWLQIEPIIQRSCASCHGPGARNGQYSTYETASKPNVVASVAVKKNMPTSGPLTAQEQQLFTQWQAGGFQRSTSVTAVNGTGSTVNGGTVGGGTVVGGSTANTAIRTTPLTETQLLRQTAIHQAPRHKHTAPNSLGIRRHQMGPSCRHNSSRVVARRQVFRI